MYYVINRWNLGGQERKGNSYFFQGDPRTVPELFSKKG